MSEDRLFFDLHWHKTTTHRQNKIATKVNCKSVRVTIANSTVPREPAAFERHNTDFICSCRSSDAMPPSQMFGTTQMFQRNHLCSHNVGGQLISISVFRPLAEPSTNDPRDTSKTTPSIPQRQTSQGYGHHFNVPPWIFGVSGSRARPGIWLRPSSLHREKSCEMPAPIKRSPQCMRQQDGEATYSTL